MSELTNEQMDTFDHAKVLLSALITATVGEAEAERVLVAPDTAKISKLVEQRNAYVLERDSLRPENLEACKAVVDRYGKKQAH